MSIATVTSKGQVTIPIDIRREMGLREGEQVEFTIVEGVASMKRFSADGNPFAKWAGCLGGLATVDDAVDWQRSVRDDD